MQFQYRVPEPVQSCRTKSLSQPTKPSPAVHSSPCRTLSFIQIHIACLQTNLMKDRIRGTPNPRGRGRSIWPKTWHITLLAPWYSGMDYGYLMRGLFERALPSSFCFDQREDLTQRAKIAGSLPKQTPPQWDGCLIDDFTTLTMGGRDSSRTQDDSIQPRLKWVPMPKGPLVG